MTTRSTPPRTNPTTSSPTPLDQLGEAALIQRVVQGHQSALAEIYERHASTVHAVATQICPPEQAADIVQDVFLHLWKSPASFDPPRQSLLSYLMLETCSRCSAARIEPPGDHQHSGDHSDRGAAARASQTERTCDPARLLRHLPPPQREAIALIGVGGLTRQQAARALQQSQATLDGHIRTGLTMLHGIIAGMKSCTP